MDILSLIKVQVQEAIAINEKIVGLESVITHIDRAELYLKNGKDNNDEHIYTDVIYRTNHAFEGILKEAYTVLAGKDGSKKTPNDIEKYLLDKNILNARVIELLQNYRTRWRNTSTHEYDLFFNHSEAFLAIVSVSAFIHILLIQILDKLLIENEKERVKNIDFAKNDEKLQYLTLFERAAILVEVFGNYFSEVDNRSPNFMKEIIAQLAVFIESSDRLITVSTEPVIHEDGRYLDPDMIIESESGEKVIIEIKVYQDSQKSNFHLGEKQLLRYLDGSGITDGILFFLPISIEGEVHFNSYQREYTIDSETYQIMVIEPL